MTNVVAPPNLDREEWLAARRKGIGGSDVAAILGLDNYRSPLAVYLEKTDQFDSPPAGEAAEWGLLLEPIVVEQWEKRTGLKADPSPGMLAHPDHPWMLANVDRLVGDDAVLEVKTTSAWLNDEWSEGKIPERALLQGQHYLAVTGRKLIHFAVLIGGQELRTYKVQRDDALIEQIIKVEGEFWQRVESRDEPPADASPLTSDLLNTRYEVDPDSVTELPDDTALWCERLRNAKDVKKDIEKRMAEYENLLKQALAECEVGTIAGETVVTWKSSSSKRLDQKALRSAHPEMCDEFSTTTECRRFLLKGVPQ